MASYCLTVTFLLMTILSLGSSVDITVVTNAGTFIGDKTEVRIDDATTYEIASFLGVPYAEPPVGPRRFRFTVRKAPLTEPLRTQNFKSRCFELNSGAPDQVSEDCLYLNIFAPERFDIDSLAVMVFIHGGGFTQGSANDYTPYLMVGHGQTIVVIINYRLTIFGFLSTDDSASIGNYGFWDQHLALEWIHDNIAAFGGDNSRITVFGESAGAVSVVFQGLYPRNQGLFQRMIAQSGTAAANWAIVRDPKRNAENVARRVNCFNQDTIEMVKCLQSTSAKELIGNITRFDVFFPTIDGVFVPCDPQNILDVSETSPSYQASRDTFASFDFMTGITSGEGIFGFVLAFGISDPDNFLPNKTYFDGVLTPQVATRRFGALDSTTLLRVSGPLAAKYTDQNDPTNPYVIRERFVKMIGDSQFLSPMDSTITLHAQLSQRRSYQYLLSVNPSFHILPTPSWFEGANHADDIIFLFPINPAFLTEEERTLSIQIITMWTNFAKTGNPNEPRPFGANWGEYTTSDLLYLDINHNISQDSVKVDLADGYGSFWNDELTTIVGAEEEICTYVFKADISGAPHYGQSICLLVLIWLIMNISL